MLRMTNHARWLLGFVPLLIAGCGTIATPAPASTNTRPPASHSLPTSSPAALPSATVVYSSQSAPSPSPAPSSSSDSSSDPAVSWLSTPIVLGGLSLGSMMLPSTWDATPVAVDGNGSGASLLWSSPSGNNQLHLVISSAYGTNHNVLSQSSPFDPALALPQAGCSITAFESSIDPFTCQGFQGFLDTGPGVSGAITVWDSGPSSATLSRILNSIQLNANDLTTQGG